MGAGTSDTRDSGNEISVSFRSSLSIEMLRVMYSFLYQLVRYPHYTKQFINHELPTRANCERAELGRYEHFSRTYLGRKLIAAAVHVTIALKLSLFVYYTFSTIDFSDPERHLEIVEDPAQVDARRDLQKQQPRLWYRFLCLETNCSRLSHPGSVGKALERQGFSLINTYDAALDERTWDQRTRLADDLARLPIFAICKSQWRHLVNPLIYTHIIGLMLLLVYAFYVLTLFTIVPAYSLLAPTQLPLIMGILCPKIELEIFKQTMSKHREALALSQLNFENRLRYQSAQEDSIFGHGFEIRPAPLRSKRFGSNSPKHIAERSLRYPISLPGLTISQSGRPQRPVSEQKSGRKLRPENLVADCLPIELTTWFRTNWPRAIAISLPLNLFGGLGTLTLVLIAIVMDETPKRVYGSYSQLVEQDGCGLFKTNEPGAAKPTLNPAARLESGSLERIDLNNLFEDWTVYQFCELIFCLVIPFSIFVMAANSYYHGMNHLRLLIIDLKNQLNVIINLAELLKQNQRRWTSRSGPGPGLNLAPSRGQRPMGRIRQRLFEIVHPNLILLYTRRLRRSDGRRGSSDLDDCLANQEFAMELMASHELDLDAFVELLKAMQINYWLLMDVIKRTGWSVTLCLFFSYFLNYGFVFIGLYVSRAFKEFVLLPLLFYNGPMLIANLLIALSSHVHASARRLEKQLWSLTASTTSFNDQRVAHFRSIWIKQLILVNADGGLALKMFGRIEVTYVQIIRFLLWTSSLLVFFGQRRAMSDTF